MIQFGNIFEPPENKDLTEAVKSMALAVCDLYHIKAIDKKDVLLSTAVGIIALHHIIEEHDPEPIIIEAFNKVVGAWNEFTETTARIQRIRNASNSN